MTSRKPKIPKVPAHGHRFIIMRKCYLGRGMVLNYLRKYYSEEEAMRFDKKANHPFHWKGFCSFYSNQKLDYDKDKTYIEQLAAKRAVEEVRKRKWKPCDYSDFEFSVYGYRKVGSGMVKISDFSIRP